MVIAYFATYTVDGDYETDKPNEHGALIINLPDECDPFHFAVQNASNYGKTINEKLISIELMEVTKDKACNIPGFDACSTIVSAVSKVKEEKSDES